MWMIPFALSGATALSEGEAAKRTSKLQARQLNIAAGQERAASQRSAEEELRRADLVGSRARAVAAASGAGASGDPTVENILTGIAAEGEYRAMTALYEGTTRSNALRYGARTARYEGRLAKQSSYGAAAGALAEGYAKGGGFGGKSMYEKYNPSADTRDIGIQHLSETMAAESATRGGYG